MKSSPKYKEDNWESEDDDFDKIIGHIEKSKKEENNDNEVKKEEEEEEFF